MDVAGISSVKYKGREARALLAAAVGALVWCAAAEPGPLVVSAVAFSERAGAGAALAELLRAALQAGGGGVEVRTAPPPRECAEGRAPDEAACLRAALAALAAGDLHALLLPAGAGALPPPPRLREAGLETWGALSRRGGGLRRACYATGVLRSLSELAAPPRALLYRAPPHLVQQLAPAPRYFCGMEEEEGCSGEGAAATALVGPEAEARALLALAARHSLRLQAVALGADWEPARALARLAALSDQPVLVCGRALDAEALAQRGARLLGPPPCDLPDCPFDARPLHKLSAAGALARSPAARAAFDRLALDEAGVRSLEARAAALGPAAAARAALQEAGGGASVRGAEVRVAVLVPLSTGRDAGSAHALRAAAELAEEDEVPGGDPPAPLRFKVELVDSGCAEARTLKYLTDALGSEFHALSATFGGACALAFEGVARQSAALDLPAVSMAWRRRSAAGTLLAASDGAAGVGALAALLAALSWRRVALLSEAGALPASGAAQALGAELAATAELEAGETSPAAAAEEWASLAAARGARILLLACEDARAARAALCACERAGLTPERGAVFVVLGPLGARGGLWLAEGEACARRQAEGALLLSPEWAARWRETSAQVAWSARWRARARAPPGATPTAAAALLYDALRLWAAALLRLAHSTPEALDDLHRPDRVTALITEVVRAPAPYVGVTGLWEWEGRARGGAAAHVRVSQWSGGRERRAGVWRGAEGGLALEPGALRWRTEGGAVPDDGAERCLWGLPCRWAGWVGGGAALLTSGALLAAGAWHCRRRAARDHRARLAAFGMRALPDKAGAPDRWELPRERLVINRKLGSGAFGAVYGGHALLAAGGGGEEGRAWAAVAVKTLKPGASTEQKLDFLSEAEVMKRFTHCCVVRLLGVVTRSEPVCTVMELMLYGDLKGYLVARRHLAGAGGEAGEEVAPARLTGMARDAALGLAYLARMRYVHRDVAARNCLVDAARRLKLADFGMTRIVFDKDYYRFGRKGMLPVRWMAPESLAHGVFSPASDVWSFGVLLYEMVTFGALPYRGLPNHEALERAKAGRPPPLPPALEPQLEALIRSCWRVERRARPTAAALAGFLAEWPRLLTPCLAPPDALDEPLQHAPSECQAAAAHEVGWAGWAAPTSAGTDTTYLSAEPAPQPPPSVREAPDSASASDPFLAMSS